MPYITCDDGHTYSRYDKSLYVKDCIQKENQRRDSLYRQCTLDPLCKHRREVAKNTFNFCTIGLFFTFVIGFLYMVFIKFANK